MSDGRTDSAVAIGSVLEGAYRLDSILGEGGMGTVYQGVHLRLNKRVAIKVMSRDLASNKEALARFRREAEVTSQIGHPHIVQTLDFGTAPTGEPFLVMEILEGEDLDRRLRKVGRLSLPAAVSIVKQVASVLAATHAKGIIHRDLKPANIFLLDVEGAADFVKVVDFGISKVRAAATKLTRGSIIMGTPDYMSPEQAQGRIDEIDHKTDQWALAVIAWEMLCGRPPFTGEDVGTVLFQVTREEPPSLTAKVPGLDPSIEKILRRALSKKSADRFPTVAALARALEEAATQPAHRVDSSVPEAPAAKPTVMFGSPNVAVPAKAVPPESDRDAPATVFDAAQDSAWAGATEVMAPAAQQQLLADLATAAASMATVEERPFPRPTTFTHAAGEITRSIARFRSRIKPAWAIAAGAGTLVLLIILLSIGSGQKRNDPHGSAASAPPATAPVRPVFAPLPTTADPTASPAVQPKPDVVAPVAKQGGSTPTVPATRPKRDRLDDPFPGGTSPAVAASVKPGTRPTATTLEPKPEKNKKAHGPRRVLIQEL